MDMISPVVADAFDLLRSDLYEHLDKADELASRPGSGAKTMWTRPAS